MPLNLRPTISHRFSVDDVVASYADGEAAFSDGNYVVAATLAAPGSALQGAARIMAGAITDGLKILNALQDIPSPFQIYLAFAHWMLGEGDSALSSLKQCATDARAAALANMVLSEQIDVLLFANPFQRSVDAFRKTAQFRVHTVGFDAGCDIRIHPDEDLCAAVVAALGKAPDLAVTLTCYATYHRDYARLPCPKIGFLTDHDYFLYNRDAFAANDMLIVNGPVEHFEVSRLYPRPCHTYYTLDLDYQIPHGGAKSEQKKRFDIGLSGSSFVPYMREKAQFAFSLMDLPDDLRVRIVQGFLPGDEYTKFVGESHLTPVAVRFSDVLNTRAIEAILRGSATFHPAGNLWPSLLGLDPHCHPYRHEAIEEDLRQALTAATDGEPIDLEAIDALLPPSPDRETRFLKYFAFLGCLQAGRETTPATVGERSGATGILLELQKRTAETARTYYEDLISSFSRGTSAHDALKGLNAGIYLCRQLPFPDIIARVVAAGENALQRFPTHLALRFNFARFLYHHNLQDRADQQFMSILEAGDVHLLDPAADDVLNYHYHIEYFPFMAYQDQALLKLIGERDPRHAKPFCEPWRVISSCACHYLADRRFQQGRINEALDLASIGIGLFPGNYNLHAALVRISWSAYHSSGNTDCLRVLADCFQSASTGYPGAFRELAWYALQALRTLGDTEGLSRLLQLWERHCARVLLMEALPLPTGHEAELCHAVLERRGLLGPEARQRVSMFAALVESLPYLPDGSPMALPDDQELLFANMLPPLLDDLTARGELAQAAAILAAALSKLQVDQIPGLSHRLMHFYQRWLGASAGAGGALS